MLIYAQHPSFYKCQIIQQGTSPAFLPRISFPLAPAQISSWPGIVHFFLPSARQQSRSHCASGDQTVMNQNEWFELKTLSHKLSWVSQHDHDWFFYRWNHRLLSRIKKHFSIWWFFINAYSEMFLIEMSSWMKKASNYHPPLSWYFRFWQMLYNARIVEEEQWHADAIMSEQHYNIRNVVVNAPAVSAALSIKSCSFPSASQSQ